MADATRVECASWEDFQAKLRVKVGKVIGPRIYRGHREGLQGYSRSLPGIVDGLRDEHWWPLARHYGLVTPLLDWTTSPYVAAFFALTDYLQHENPRIHAGPSRGGVSYGGSGAVAVWEIIRDDELRARVGELDIIEPDLPFFAAAERVRVQGGFFSWLHDDVHVDLESMLLERGFGHLLSCYLIPLGDTAINFAKLFPDLGGAAMQANLGTLLEDLHMGDG